MRVLIAAKPEEAILTEGQVTGQVISCGPDIKVMVIKQVSFNAERKVWTVRFREGLDSNTVPERKLEIEDEQLPTRHPGTSEPLGQKPGFAWSSSSA